MKQKAGWATMVWTLGLLSGFSSIITILWVGGWIGKVGLLGGGGHNKKAVDEKNRQSMEAAEGMDS